MAPKFSYIEPLFIRLDKSSYQTTLFWRHKPWQEVKTLVLNRLKAEIEIMRGCLLMTFSFVLLYIFLNRYL